MQYQDYYQTLGLARDASPAEIKKAFRRLARQHHPDKQPGDTAAEQRFKLINEAHAVLSDPDKRRKYDTLGANWEAYSRADAAGGPFAAGGASGPGRAGRSGNVRYEFRTAGGGDFSDFFRVFFGADEAAAPGGRRGGAASGATLEEMLAQMGLDQAAGRSASSTRVGDRGAAAPAHARQTAEAIAEIGLEEAWHGTTRLVEVDGKRLQVTIPRGADSGTRVKLSGQGPGGGDLVVVVRVRPHPIFARRGADLERELPLTLGEALLGSEVPVATLKGRVLLRIPAGTQNGRIFRLKGQGMPHLRGEGAGDLLARVRVLLPGPLEGEAEEAARRFVELAAQPDPR